MHMKRTIQLMTLKELVESRDALAKEFLYHKERLTPKDAVRYNDLMAGIKMVEDCSINALKRYRAEHGGKNPPIEEQKEEPV